MTIDESIDFLRLLRDPAVIIAGGRIVAANSLMVALSGHTIQELAGREITELVSAIDPDGSSSHGGAIFGLPRGLSAATLSHKDGRQTVVTVAARRLQPGDQSSPALHVFELPPGSPAPFTSPPPAADMLLLACVETAETAIAVIGRTGRVAMANRKCCDLLGYERLDIIGSPWLSLFVATGHRQLAAGYFQRLIAGSARLEDSYEAPMPTRGGMKRVMRWNATTLTDEGSRRVVGMVVCGSDITEQKRVAEALEDMERRYRLVSDNVTDVVWTYDLASRKVTFAGQAIAQIIGFTNEEILEIGPRPLFAPHSYDVGMNEMERHLRLDASMPKDHPHSWTLELEQVNKNGDVVWVEVTSRIVRDPLSGRPVGLTGVTRDITGRKKAELVLQESERRYRTLFENSMDAICIISRDGRIVDMNRSALDMFGYPRESLTKLNIDDLARGPEVARFKEEIEQRGFVRNFPMTLRRVDGAILDCVLTFGLRRDGSASITGYEGSIRDITRYRRLQENLRLYINEVTSAQEQERYRLSRELHDGLLQDLLALALSLEEAVRTQDQSLGVRLEQLMQMRDEVGRLARETRRMSHALSPGVLQQLGLVAAIRTMTEGLNGAGIEGDFTLSGQEEHLDPDVEVAIFRTAQEALNNAKKHSGARTVLVGLQYEPGRILLTVVDDGRGFEVPRRLSDYAAAKKLGLIGMEQRAETLGGSLIVDSQPNRGTSVRAEIPHPHAAAP